MKVQDYLISNASLVVFKSIDARRLYALDCLHEKFGIKVKKYDDRVVLNYSQIDSPKTHPIVRECRGLILSFPDFEVMARGFDRFYNHGECPEFTDKVDFKNSTVYEKVDGSYVNVYHDGEQWQVATRGTAFAEAENYTGRPFREMILEAFGCDINEVFSYVGFRTTFTFIFEFISPENRIVTRYEKPEMVLTAVRCRASGEYIRLDGVELLPLCVLIKHNKIHMRFAKTFDISTAEAALQAAKELPNLQEGYVVYDHISGERVKIKSPMYVAVHHIKGEGLTPKRIASLVLSGEIAEYLNYYPEDSARVEPYSNALEWLIFDMQDTYEQHGPIINQEGFALRVKDEVYSAVLFTARSTEVSVEQAFTSFKHTAQVKLLLAYMKERGDTFYG